MSYYLGPNSANYNNGLRLAFNGAIVLPSRKVFWTLDKVF